MGFWTQFLGVAALFTVVELLETELRRQLPGRRHIFYWAVKFVVGLPFVIWILWEVRRQGYTLEPAALVAGICAPAAFFLWLHGDSGSGPPNGRDGE